MSKLAQIKREAKRLLKLAQETQNQIEIPNLASAQKVIAHTNGYKSWHDFEVNLNKENWENKIEEPEIHKYLTNETIYNLKSLYSDELILKNTEYDTRYQHVFSENANKDNQIKNIGYITEKGIFSDNKIGVNYYKRNHLIIGGAGSGKSELLKNIMIDFSSESCTCFLEYEGVELYKRLSISKKEIMGDIYYCSLLNRNVTSHSIDLINPLIDVEIGFKKSFNVENELLEDIFFKLAKFYRGLNQALDSQNLKAFLSLRWLNSFKEDIFIKGLIEKYFKSLNINEEIINEDSFFNEYYLIIQEHHKNCYNTQIILSEMKYYEDKGVFSKESQINFVELLKNKKHIIFDLYKQHLSINNKNHKDLVNFIYNNYFYILKERNNFLTDNIHEKIYTSWGFSAITLIEHSHLAINAKTLTIINDILQSFKSPIFLFDQNLENWEVQNHQLLNHVDYYIFLKSEITSNDLIPEICKKMLLKGKDNFTNIAKKILDIRGLYVGKAYYWTDANENKKSINKNCGYMKKSDFDLIEITLNYYQGVIRDDTPKNLVNYQPLKKLK